MAYYLDFDGVNDEVTFSDVLANAPTFLVEIDLVIKTAPLDYNALLHNNPGAGGTARNHIFHRSNRSIEVACVIGGTRRVFNTATNVYNLNEQFNLKLEYNGSLLALKINDTTVGSIACTGNLATTATDKGFTTLGNEGVLGYPDIDLYRLKFTDNGTLVRDYDPSASNGTGSTLPDTVGSNDGTLVNFPTDDSQWVFYSTGAEGTATHQAVTATQSATGTVGRQISLSGTFSPGQTITATLTNYVGTPTLAILSDTNSNILNLTLTPATGDDYTFVLPSLPTVGNNTSSLLFGNVSVTINDPGI